MNTFSMSMARRDTCCPARSSSNSSSSIVVGTAAAAPRPSLAALAVPTAAAAAACRRLLSTTTPSSHGAFTALPLSAHRFPAKRLSTRSRGSAAIKERTIVAVAMPQSSGESSSSLSSSKILTLPTLLTLSRVAAVPLLIVLWYTSPPKLAPLRLAALFAAASLTDAIDGYLARKWDQCTPFGAFLDPVADKLMVVTALLLIVSRPAASCAAGWAPWVVPAATAAIVGREVAMSALREWAAGVGGKARGAAAVSWAGKAKTAAQMVAVSALLLASGRPCCVPAAGSPGMARAVHDAACAVGVPALVVSAALALASFGQYLSALWPWLLGARKD